MSMMGTESISKTQVIRLALIGFSGPALASLELFAGKDRRLSLQPADKADLLIVNGDQGKDPQQLQAEYASKYGKPGVLISVRDLAWPSFVLLKKPYETSALFSAIESALQFSVGVVCPQESKPVARAAKVAAVAALPGSANEHRQEAFERYREKMGGGHALHSEIEIKRQQEEERRQQMKERLRRGKDAGRRLAEAAEQAREAEETRQEVERQAEEARRVAAERAEQERLELEERKAREAAKKREAQRKLQEAAKRAEAEAKLEEQRKLKAEQAAKDAAKRKAEARRKLKAERQAALQVQKAIQKQAAQAVSPAAEQPVLSLTDVAIEAPAVVPPEVKHAKPANKTLLNDDEMVYRCCGNLPDVDISRPDERRRIYFSADGALLYWLPLAMKKARLGETPVEIAGLPRLFAFLPKTGQFYGDFGEELLLQYALSRFGFGELDLRERPDLDVKLPEVTGEKQIVDSADAMLWKVALWTARGRLAQGVDPEKVYKLKKRPDFDCMVEIPHAREISELWHERRLSAMDVVRILNIHQRYIFAYMSAVNALGWLQE